MPALGSTRPLSILVADDDFGHRRMLELVLSAHRFDVVGVQDGREALDLLRREVPDVVILDVDMPHANGFEVCDKVRSDERLNHVPVIIMTGETPERIEARLERSKPDAIVYKPISGQNLRRLIGDLISKRS